MIGRRSFLRILAAAAGGAAGPSQATTAADWALALSVGSRFTSAGIPAQAFNLPTTDMMPTLSAGDVLLGDLRGAGKMPKRSDVISFIHKDGSHFIKRVVGLPGDRIAFRNWQLYLNGEAVPTEDKGMIPVEMFGIKQYFRRSLESPKGSDPYLVGRGTVLFDNEEKYGELDEVRVPDGRIFVVGDNRSNSLDSRFESMPPVHVADVLSRIVFRLRPNAGWLVPESSVEGLAAR